MHRAFAFRDGEGFLAVDTDAHGGFATGVLEAALHGDVILHDFKRYDGRFAHVTAKQQGQRGIGVLEAPTFVFELLELIERDAGRRSVLVEFDTQLSGLEEQVTAARLVADQNITRIAHGGRIYVLVGGRKLPDGIDVRAALVGERGRAHPRTTWIGGLVGNSIDEAGESGQTLE